MPEITHDELERLQEACWHAAHLARVASAFAQSAIMEPPAPGVERDTARLAVKDTLDTLVRDADVAAARLEDLVDVAGAGQQDEPATEKGALSCYCVHMADNDLAPRWRAGEVAVIAAAVPVEIDDEVLVAFADGTRTLRLLTAEDHATVTLGTFDGSPPVVHDRSAIVAMHYVCGRLKRPPAG